MSEPPFVYETGQQEARRMWWTILIGTLICSVSVLWLPTTYSEADDLGALMILAGEDGFAAAPEVPFLSFSLNQLFVQLYQWFPGFSWYGFLLVMTQGAGLSLLFYCLLFKLKQTPWLGMVFPFFLIFSLYSLLTVTFTQACLTLLFAVAAAISCRASLNDWPVLTRRGLACLLLWALFWRWKFGLICLVFFVPLAIVQFSQLRKYFRLLAMVLGLLAVDRFIHHQWASPEWHQYMEFYETRAKLFDMPAGRAGENLELALQSAGWSAEDYQLIRESWMLYDERLTNQASMTRFIEAVGNHGGASVIEQIEGNLRNNARLLYAFLPISLAIMILGIRSWAEDPQWQRKSIALLCLLGPVLFLAYFRLVPRILVPIFLYGFTLLNLWTESELSESKSGKLSAWNQTIKLTPMHFLAFLPIVIGLGTSCLVLQQQWKDTREKRAAFTASETLVEELNQPTTLLRTQVSALPGWEGIHPYQRMNQGRDLRVIPSGWQVGSPRYFNILRELGYESGSQLISGFASSTDDGEYFVQRFTRTRGVVKLYSEQWLAYLKRHHPDRSFENPEVNVIAIGSRDQKLSLLKLMPASDEEITLESLLPE